MNVKRTGLNKYERWVVTLTKLVYLCGDILKQFSRNKTYIATILATALAMFFVFTGFASYFLFKQLQLQLIRVNQTTYEPFQLMMNGLLLVVCLAGLLGVTLTKRTHFHLFLAQKKAYNIQYLLGASRRNLSLFYGLQVFFSMSISCLIGLCLASGVFRQFILVQIPVDSLQYQKETFLFPWTTQYVGSYA